VNRTQFVAASQVVIVAGKGGVGKTTVSAAAALATADEGQEVLAVEVDGTGALRRLLGCPDAGPEPVPCPLRPTSVSVASIDPSTALSGYLADHGLGRLGGRLARTGMLDLVATATPGIRDLVVLGRLRQLADHYPDKIVIVDAPAAGHALAFLRTPRDILDTVDGGRIADQAQLGVEFLADHDRSSVTLVTLPQETPINELVETAFAIEDELGVALGPVIVNSVEPPLTESAPVDEVGLAAHEFFTHRAAAEAVQLVRMETELPLPWFALARADGPIDRQVRLEQLARSLRSANSK